MYTPTSHPHPRPARRLSWSWLPSLMFGDGMLLSVIVLLLLMLRRYGLNNAQATLYVSLLCTLFVLRPLFERIVTYFNGTTKVWILSVEFISALSLWATAFTLPTNYWFEGVMCFMPFTIVSGIFHHIATTRFYLDQNPTTSVQHTGRIAMLFHLLSLLFGIGIVAMLAGNMEVLTRSIRYPWSFVFYVMAGIEFFLWLWHSIFLPGGSKPYAAPKDLFGLHRGQYATIIDTILHGFHNRAYLYIFLFFLLPEGFLCLVSPLFFIDAPHNGGLGLSPQEFGLSYGTIGIVAIFVGNTIGAKVLHHFKHSRCIIPMSIALVGHGMSMLYLSYNLGTPFFTICLATFVGNVGLGIGITTIASVRDTFASPQGSTLRSSIAIAMTSLTTVLASLFSGLLQISIGYRQYFTIATCLYIIPLVLAIIYTSILITDKHSDD